MAEQRPTYEELLARVKEYDSLFNAIRTQQADAVVGLDHISMLRPHDLEIALRTSEERFRMLADNMAQLAWISDAEGRAMWFNRRFQDFTGMDIGRLSAEERLMVHHPDHRERLQRSYAASIASGEPFEETLPLRDRHGRYHWFLSRAVPMRDAKGRITGWFGTNTDITEQRKAEDALRESERMLALIYHNTSDVLYLVRVDPNDRFTFTSVNETFLKVTGYTREQVTGKPMEQVVPTANVDLVREKYHEAIATRRLVHYYETADLPAGRRHAQITIVPIFDGEGPVTHLLASIIDFTQRQAAEDARQLADARYRAIVESSDDAIVSKDLNGIVISWNKGAEQLFGFTAKEMVGQHITKLIPAELLDEEARILGEVRAGRPVQHYETVRQRKNGTRIDISLTISPIRDEQGTIIGASKVARDITAQKLIRDQVRESEEKFTTIFKQAPIGTVVADAGTGKILEANPAFLDLCGFTIDELTGKPALLQDPSELRNMLESIERDGKVRDMEARITHRSGRPMDVLINATTVRIADVPRLLVHVEDITDRKATVAALKEADRRKDEFLATLAHELRSPLAPLSNAVQLLDLAADDPEMSARARTIMTRQLEHMVHLVDDLMDLSRVTRGVIELRKVPLDLNAVLGQAIEAARPMIDRQGHQLKLDLNGTPLWLEGDSTRLVQIFNNLLNNASKYTDPGGTITLHSEQKNGRVIATVTDTGIGIEAAQLDKVFDMFAQMEPTSTRAHDGLGIGLSIVRRLVRMHGGDIAVSSEGRGHGTRFTVSLPTITAPERELKDAVAGDAHATRLNVLVTDDNVESAVTFAMVLRKMGHEARVTHSGDDALAEIPVFKPDVVFMDIGMPHMDGYEACRRIRATAGGVDVFMIALTGWGQDEDRRQAIAAGFDLHLVKPIGREALINVLDEVQERRVTARQ